MGSVAWLLIFVLVDTSLRDYYEFNVFPIFKIYIRIYISIYIKWFQPRANLARVVRVLLFWGSEDNLTHNRLVSYAEEELLCKIWPALNQWAHIHCLSHFPSSPTLLTACNASLPQHSWVAWRNSQVFDNERWRKEAAGSCIPCCGPVATQSWMFCGNISAA